MWWLSQLWSSDVTTMGAKTRSIGSLNNENLKLRKEEKERVLKALK